MSGAIETTGITGDDNICTNDNDDLSTLVGKNGNVLRITWERDVANDILRLANESRTQSDSTQQQLLLPLHKKPYMVAIAGVPGSGKSSSAEIITHLINHGMSSTSTNPTTTSGDDICVCIPADGYHYSLATLNELQQTRNDTTLIYRRGAPDTFDVPALLQDLSNIRHPTIDDGTTTIIPMVVTLPGFDHAIGDPTIDQHSYNRHQHSIVIMEGLYLLYDQHNWDDVKQYFDCTIYIQTASVDTCMERVKERNVCIPGYTIEEIHERVDLVDRNNALQIDQVSPLRADQVISSLLSSYPLDNLLRK